MKQSGRVGHAGLPGFACQAHTIELRNGDAVAVALSLSGNGEQLIETDLAAHVVAAVASAGTIEEVPSGGSLGPEPEDSLEDVVRSQLRRFLHRGAALGGEAGLRHAGLISMCAHSTDPCLVDFAVGHTTRHLAYAFQGSGMPHPKVTVSCLLNEEAQDGRVVCTSGTTVTLR